MDQKGPLLYASLTSWTKKDLCFTHLHFQPWDACLVHAHPLHIKKCLLVVAALMY